MDLHSRARNLFAELQEGICEALERLDGKARFREDRWQMQERSGAGPSGGGTTRVLARGRVFEKAGVSVADVSGDITERLAARLEVDPQPFQGTGISLVLHPLSPLVPTVHMNLRYLQLLGSGVGKKAWFGGGADLTPYYLFEEDVRHFHQVWRRVCDRHDPSFYLRFKAACDEYFRLPHRNEARGVGGIFFDSLSDRLEQVSLFIEDVGRSFLESYVPIVERRASAAWWDREREWQLNRRSRYAEFNLLHDRGTLFGLETGGRTESILISLPPLARWTYDYRPLPGSAEEALLEVLRVPRAWA
jgi:coproporphyrinogen III oxidase